PQTVKRHVTAALDAARGGQSAPTADAVVAEVLARLAAESRRGLIGVLNGTGILLHTNLGRAPLAREALDAIADAAGGASNLEYDLESGTRGSRYDRLGALLRAATGAEDALVVNNCAAAVLLVLDTFARAADGSPREVVVARNQLIEIGGGFRLPDVLARSGATLVEVGATNKVRLDDYARALSPRTALLMRVHPSNYRIEGFTADVGGAELVALGRRAGVPVVEDLGSGALTDLRAYGLPHERTVQEAVADGIDLVAFSGDKLLGGPQAGIVAGRAAAIARMRANPLLRALRVGSPTIAALGATLRLHLDAALRDNIPFYRMLATPLGELRARAEALCARLDGMDVRAERVDGYAGGGTLPLAALESVALAWRPAHGNANAAAARLRGGTPPLIARVEDDRVLIDLRTIPPERDADMATALASLR
ncbi:MAG: L-seryl-tRNA(Ser) seleniumtransferase, partial [Candidatus Eremiobacteraeota bacterium]|nr:L-seryl-tRNA(Ser) seleniumtransferase [Candidatus Eremiobacteraeota bacterium]